MTSLVEEVEYLDPVRAAHAFADEAGTVLLDSARVDPGRARHTYLFAEPFARLEAKDEQVLLDGRVVDVDPLAWLHDALARWRTAPVDGLAAPVGAAAGYLAYDLGRRIERLPPPRRPVATPDLCLGFYDVVLVWDHVRERCWAASTGRPEEEAARRRDRARRRLVAFRERLAAAATLPDVPPPPRMELAADFTRADYERAVQRVVEHILAGDIFQANLTQRFHGTLQEDAFTLYRRLRRDNPAPFAAWLDFATTKLLSASPERFLRVEGGHVETRPIKGTRPRGATPAEDERLAAELRASAKDHAENVMIVDLLRNDLSRVCRPNSIRVPELCLLESFATVHHLVSTVEGRLREGAGLVDLLRATFPGGSITGAPKIRAMEILAALEPVARGPYCGGIGYLGFDGRMDTNIAIRTIVVDGDAVSYHAGGGVIADSDPAAEYEETLAKGCALRAALGGDA